MLKTSLVLAGLMWLAAPAAGAGGKKEEDALRAVVQKCGQPEVPRTELLADFRAVLKSHPSGNYAEQVRWWIATLEVMVAEDRAHAARAPARPSAWLTTRERVAELIHQL